MTEQTIDFLAKQAYGAYCEQLAIEYKTQLGPKHYAMHRPERPWELLEERKQKAWRVAVARVSAILGNA